MNLASAYTRNFLCRFALLAGASLLTAYLFYRATFINFSPIVVIFSILLFLAELHTILHFYGLFYSLWPRNYKRYAYLNRSTNLRINMFICVCGEPAEIVKETILAAIESAKFYKNVVRPKIDPKVIVLNDGLVAGKNNWRDIESLARELGVEHIARNIPGGFKAGNINNGLLATPTEDPHNTIDIVFDSDFAAKLNFLTEITKPFIDIEIDFAQSPQRYKNENTWVAKASAAHQIFFFDYICDAKGYDNALFLCGTNFAIRRSALESIGGMDTRFITEDYATSLELHLKGKKGVFVPMVLAEGIAPSTLKAYFSQQQRWSKGSFDVTRTYLKKIMFGKLTLRQKFHYLLSSSYYLIGVRDFILMLAPLPYLFFGISLIKANTWQFLALVYGPLFVYNFVLYLILFKHPIKSLVLDIASFPIFIAAFLSSLFKKDLSFIVTIKKYEKENPFGVYKLQMGVVVLLAIGLYFGIKHPIGQGGAFLNYFWASFNLIILSLGFYLIVRENYNFSTIENYISKAGISTRNLFRPLLPALPKSVYAIFVIVLLGLLTVNTPIFERFTSLVSATTKVNQSKTELLVPSQGVYYGYYNPSLNTHPQNPETNVLDGEKTSLVMYYQDWSNDFGFDIEFANKLSQNGRVPVVTWEPWDSSKNQHDLLQSTSIDPQSIINGDHDEYIKTWAKGVKEYNKPIFIRFAHEMNGNWYPWGNKNSSETYVVMWRHVHDIFEQEGADNALWLWSPNNTDEYGKSTSLLSYYPGDAYVDWVGFSGFNWGKRGASGKWVSFKQLSAEAYMHLSTLNKPIMVTETSSSSVGGNKQSWFRQTIKNDIPNMPLIKGVILFNQDTSKADFAMNSGQDFEKIATEVIINNNYLIRDPVFKYN